MADWVADLPIGASASFTKTIGEVDVTLFAGLTGDLHPVHIDEELMRKTPYGRRLVHGVFVLGSSVRAVHQRAVALEQRCQRAWHIRAAGGRTESALPEWWLERSRLSDGNGFLGFWEAMVRAELRSDPTLLSGLGHELHAL